MDEKEENLNLQVQESSKEKIVRNIKFSLYHTYYTLLSFKFTSCLFYIILLIIEFIQCSLLLLFHLSFSDFSSDNNSIALPLQYKHINSFIKKTNVINRIFKDETTQGKCNRQKSNREFTPVSGEQGATRRSARRYS